MSRNPVIPLLNILETFRQPSQNPFSSYLSYPMSTFQIKLNDRIPRHFYSAHERPSLSLSLICNLIWVALVVLGYRRLKNLSINSLRKVASFDP